MIKHTDLGNNTFGQNRALKTLIDTGKISIAGNRKLKIFGSLNCKSGKRMKADNRVFFTDAQEAINCGYRPCGHCMRHSYLKWKH